MPNSQENEMKTAIFLVLTVAALGAIGVTITVISSAITAHAANPVAPSAQSNRAHQTSCIQQNKPAQECATGFDSNGQHTSRAAHFYNKP